MSNEIAISEIKRNRAAALAQDLMDRKYIAWLYVFRKQYWEFNYSGYKYPDAIRPAVDGRYQIRDVKPLARALVDVTVTKENRMVYPGELLDSNGEPFIVQLNEVRFDENGDTRYVVDENGEPHVAVFSLAQFKLEPVETKGQHEKPTKDQHEPLPISKPHLPNDKLPGIRNDRFTQAVRTYLEQCQNDGKLPTEHGCWIFLRERATSWNEHVVEFPTQRGIDSKVSRGRFGERFNRIRDALNKTL